MENDNGEEITEGSVWYVRFPGDDHQLYKALIWEVTQHTVTVEPQEGFRKRGRYEEGYLKFVERVS